MADKVLVVQRGHVPRRTGATGTAGEQKVVTDIAAAMGPLTPAGWRLEVIDADPADSAYRGDVFIALHCDGGASTASGASVGYPDEAGRALAQRWKAAYAAQGWNRGFRPDNYTAGLRGYYAYDNALSQGNKVRMVIEHGFLTNVGDAAWIRANIKKCAAAIWSAVAGEENQVAELTHLYIVVVDQGDPKHRAALDAIAAKQSDRAVSGTTSFAVHTTPGLEADAYINYAKANKLDCQSDYTTKEAYLRMTVRNKGVMPAGTSCSTEIAKLEADKADARIATAALSRIINR